MRMTLSCCAGARGKAAAVFGTGAAVDRAGGSRAASDEKHGLWMPLRKGALTFWDITSSEG